MRHLETRLHTASTLSRAASVSACLVGLGLPCAWPQAPVVPPPPHIPVITAPGTDGPPTLHIYANLEQIPTLVLTPSHGRLKHVDPSRFQVRLDSGPPFKPTHVRVEGDDPIALAILIDQTVSDTDLLPAIEESIARLAPGPLQPIDRVSIYSLNCTLIRTASRAPAAAASLRDAAQRAMAPWTTPLQQPQLNQQTQTSCTQSIPLLDSLAYITRQLYQQPGRRVLIAITDGNDSGSHTTWKQLLEFAQNDSVAVFGVLTPDMKYRRTHEAFKKSLEASRALGLISQEDPFNITCELSGAVEMHTNRKNLPRTIERIVAMVRERYIVEFPRSDSLRAGIHTIHVSILKTNAYVRSAGLAVPEADLKLLADPSTMPSNPASAPDPGTRKVLRPTPP